jgi:hypothetical protein
MAKFGKEIGEVVNSYTLRQIEFSISEAGNAWKRVAMFHGITCNRRLYFSLKP